MHMALGLFYFQQSALFEHFLYQMKLISMFEATNLTQCLNYLLHFPMKVFVQLVDKEYAPKAPTTGARSGSRPLPRDPVTGIFIYNNNNRPFLYNNVAKLVNSILTLSPLNTNFSRLNEKCLRHQSLHSSSLLQSQNFRYNYIEHVHLF